MPTGPLGGPRPFTDGPIQMELEMESHTLFEMSVEEAEQELRRITERNGDMHSKPDVSVIDTYMGRGEQEGQELVGSIHINLRTDEMGFKTLKEILEFVDNTFPIDYKNSMIV